MTRILVRNYCILVAAVQQNDIACLLLVTKRSWVNFTNRKFTFFKSFSLVFLLEKEKNENHWNFLWELFTGITASLSFIALLPSMWHFRRRRSIDQCWAPWIHPHGSYSWSKDPVGIFHWKIHSLDWFLVPGWKPGCWLDGMVITEWFVTHLIHCM